MAFTNAAFLTALPYRIADRLVPRNTDAPEGRDVLVAILGLSISEEVMPEWHGIPRDDRPIDVERGED